MRDLLSELNPEQQKAARALNGPVLILAGAGSGKTRTLTYRLAHLMQKGVSPMNILAVTFTNKAAGEMKERVRELIGQKARMPLIGTFHSICLKILRIEIERLGYEKSFVIYDDSDQKALVKRACIKLGIDIKQTHPNIFKYMISSAKNELMTPDDLAARASEVTEELAAKVYKEYQSQLKACNAVDFDDIIMLAVQLFEKHKEILRHYQEQFKYIMVDEYQDTNHAQYELIDMLAKRYRNICVVGDDWQAIYSFRGADLQNILDFEKDYPDAKVYLLEQNYRSTQKILDAAQAVIAQNTRQKKKKLWTEADGGADVELHETSDERDESRFIAIKIREMVQEKKAQFRDFAVLYRTNAQSRAVEEACLEWNIPYRVVGGIRFYDRKEIRDVLAYLSLLNNPKDIMAFERVANVPARGLGSSTLSRVIQYSITHDITIIEATAHAKEIPGLAPNRITALEQFAHLMDSLKEAEGRLTIDHFIEYVLGESSYKTMLLDGTKEGEDRYENIQELKTVARNYKSLEGFLDNVALVADTDSYDQNANVVTLMTLHSAKGLEFNNVFMVGVEEGILPHAQSMLSQQELDEERRLCYVGMTRARKSLHLLFASFRTIYGKPQANSISRFMNEIPDELIVKNISTHGSFLDVSYERDSEFMDDLTENPFSVGDRVYHATFGKGEITDTDLTTVTVRFSEGATRELSVAHAPLKKIEE